MKVHQNRPQLEVNEEFRRVCEAIRAEDKSAVEWDQCESDDWFQTDHFKGGYDATEQEFCFSYYDTTGKEWWFQFSYEDVSRILDGELRYLDLGEPFG